MQSQAFCASMKTCWRRQRQPALRYRQSPSQQSNWPAGSKVCPKRRRMPCSSGRRGGRAAGCRRPCSAASGPNGQQEAGRQARAAAAAREQRLDALALREEKAWQQVDSLIDTRKPREYDEAVAILLDLRALAERAGDGNAFSQRFRQLREQHLRKPSLIQRFDKAGLGPEAQRSGMTRV